MCQFRRGSLSQGRGRGINEGGERNREKVKMEIYMHKYQIVMYSLEELIH